MSVTVIAITKRAICLKADVAPAELLVQRRPGSVEPPFPAGLFDGAEQVVAERRAARAGVGYTTLIRLIVRQYLNRGYGSSIPRTKGDEPSTRPTD